MKKTMRTCSRGHRYAGPGPCPICWPGSRRKNLTSKKSKDVDAYIAKAPKAMRAKLAELRAIIRKTAPMAGEKMSYGMPYYGYKGRLAYFALAKAWIGLYIPPPIIQRHAKELKSYGQTISSIHLPLDKKLPTALIRKLVKARMKWNESKAR